MTKIVCFLETNGQGQWSSDFYFTSLKSLEPVFTGLGVQPAYIVTANPKTLIVPDTYSAIPYMPDQPVTKT